MNRKKGIFELIILYFSCIFANEEKNEMYKAMENVISLSQIEALRIKNEIEALNLKQQLIYNLDDEGNVKECDKIKYCELLSELTSIYEEITEYRCQLNNMINEKKNLTIEN